MRITAFFFVAFLATAIGTVAMAQGLTGVVEGMDEDQQGEKPSDPNEMPPGLSGTTVEPGSASEPAPVLTELEKEISEYEHWLERERNLPQLTAFRDLDDATAALRYARRELETFRPKIERGDLHEQRFQLALAAADVARLAYIVPSERIGSVADAIWSGKRPADIHPKRWADAVENYMERLAHVALLRERVERKTQAPVAENRRRYLDDLRSRLDEFEDSLAYSKELKNSGTELPPGDLIVLRYQMSEFLKSLYPAILWELERERHQLTELLERCPNCFSDLSSMPLLKALDWAEQIARTHEDTLEQAMVAVNARTDGRPAEHWPLLLYQRTFLWLDNVTENSAERQARMSFEIEREKLIAKQWEADVDPDSPEAIRARAKQLQPIRERLKAWVKDDRDMRRTDLQALRQGFINHLGGSALLGYDQPESPLETATEENSFDLDPESHEALERVVADLLRDDTADNR